MELRDKVAQMFTFGAFGPQLDEETRRLISELHAGGIFLGTSCFQEPEQTHALVAEMQRLSITEGSGIPLFISADFVAGAGCKLPKGAVQFPKNRAIGAVGDEQLAYDAAKATAVESLAMGVNFNYSPVVDVNNNPLNPVIGTHSFGSDPELVSLLSSATIRGYQEHGMIATAKHFPGHGDTQVDSHESLPVLPFSKERLRSFELPSFVQAIQSGVDAIMVGHIAVPSLDPSNRPASLSYELTTKLLREELEFDGLIVTDGLSMKGITNQFTMEEACVEAVKAGADILLATANHFMQAAAMLEAVVQAVRSGLIAEARIDQSLHRIRRQKQKCRLTAQLYRFNPFDNSLLLGQDALETSRMLARQALKPLHGLRQGMVESEQKWIVIRERTLRPFADAFKQKLDLGMELIAESVEHALQLVAEHAAGQNLLLAIACNKPIGAEWLERLEQELDKAKQVVWVHFGSEYDVRDTAYPCLLMYDRAPSLQMAAAEYLLQ